MSPEGDGQGLCGQMVVGSNKDYPGLEAPPVFCQRCCLTTEAAGWCTDQKPSLFFFRLSAGSVAPLFHLCHPVLHSYRLDQGDEVRRVLRHILAEMSWSWSWGTSVEFICPPPLPIYILESLFTSYRITDIQSGNEPPLFKRICCLFLPCFFFVTLTTEAHLSRSGGVIRHGISVCFAVMFFVKLSERNLLLVIDEDRSNKRLEFSWKRRLSAWSHFKVITSDRAPNNTV